MMNQQQLKELIEKGESEKVEFKKSTAQLDKGLKAICAFLNHRGGEVYFGIIDGKVVGQDVSDQTLKSISQKIRQKIKPEISPRITIIGAGKTKIIKVAVKEGLNKLYYLDGVAYNRVGTENPVMPPEEIERAIMERGKRTWDSEICERAELNDIDEEKINWYLEQREIARNISREIKIPINQFLQNIKALEGDKPTHAGILFFGKVPQKFLPNARLRVIRFKGTKVIHPTLDTANCEGTIWEMINAAEDFIRKNIRLLGTRTETSFRREDKFEYPIKAVKEAILNALIHRNYLETGDVRVFIFDNRVEIINPGAFPNGVTPDNPAHKPVNEILCQFVYDTGFIEKYGSGIYMMKDLCRKWGNNEPCYDFHPIETRIIFESPVKETSFIETDEFEGLNERQRSMMRFLYKYGKFTRKDYAAENKVSLRHANREINELIDKGKIIKHGKGRGVYYRLP